jgi:hypothetical protein
MAMLVSPAAKAEFIAAVHPRTIAGARAQNRMCVLMALRQSAKDESAMASTPPPRRTVTLVMPSNPRNSPVGTSFGPGEGAVPGAGCGKAVERAVWKVTLPSTFCMS